MLFENDNNYLEMLMNLNDLETKKYNYMNNKQMNTNSPKLESDTIGFLKGNMFTNEYMPYKNYTYIKPKVNGEKQNLLFKIMEASFVVNDYNLYLDLNPDNMEMFNKFKTATERLKKLTKEYEEKFGPLCVEDANYNNYKWIESPWPWQKEDGKYV